MSVSKFLSPDYRGVFFPGLRHQGRERLLARINVMAEELFGVTISFLNAAWEHAASLLKSS